ncbi:hypothetical protein SP15_172 [Bacillus phage SP-15]|uniref:Uncharacterized protein n=1 Tax=Bacillus phage SP-15 TaxID=1792032 RepID=A0A127AWI8_9CAUD|nr:hypothetical protein SP15_172 [Bacillus phage SP-15]AMM44970.1 hypothetical protein SP15_172 [Bacillus phage SP-15]
MSSAVESRLQKLMYSNDPNVKALGIVAEVMIENNKQVVEAINNLASNSPVEETESTITVEALNTRIDLAVAELVKAYAVKNPDEKDQRIKLAIETLGRSLLG